MPSTADNLFNMKVDGGKIVGFPDCFTLVFAANFLNNKYCVILIRKRDKKTILHPTRPEKRLALDKSGMIITLNEFEGKFKIEQAQMIRKGTKIAGHWFVKGRENGLYVSYQEVIQGLEKIKKEKKYSLRIDQKIQALSLDQIMVPWK